MRPRRPAFPAPNRPPRGAVFLLLLRAVSPQAHSPATPAPNGGAGTPAASAIIPLPDKFLRELIGPSGCGHFAQNNRP